MTNQELLKRITCDHAVMVGKPVIRGTRLTVEYILNLLAQGSTVQEIRQRLSLKILCLAAHFPAHLTPGRNGAKTQSF
ncbi:DUF433 domain-containing protein, partial [Candidatus Thiosymbion oneisti]|uniref:DUF433 domain-containing protein n=1 Tax=Candidatus Thiosymbion oneisti TaxID=589554 RepID=UPI000A5B2835